MMNSHIERITVNPEICNGKPIIRNLRISVRTVLEYLAAGESTENILAAYHILEAEDISACLEFAANAVDSNLDNHRLAS